MSLAKPKDACAGRYACMMNRSLPSLISSLTTLALLLPSTAYTPALQQHVRPPPVALNSHGQVSGRGYAWVLLAYPGVL